MIKTEMNLRQSSDNVKVKNIQLLDLLVLITLDERMKKWSERPYLYALPAVPWRDFTGVDSTFPYNFKVKILVSGLLGEKDPANSLPLSKDVFNFDFVKFVSKKGNWAGWVKDGNNQVWCTVFQYSLLSQSSAC